MPITIQQIPFGTPRYHEIVALRNEVLRKPIGMKIREQDVALDAGETHIAALDDGRIVGCVLLRPLENGAVKLRQMAVTENHRGQGIGADLVRFAEKIAADQGFTHIETNARKTAQGFYEKLGYQTVGNEFIEVSLHTIKMIKIL